MFQTFFKYLFTILWIILYFNEPIKWHQLFLGKLILVPFVEYRICCKDSKNSEDYHYVTFSSIFKLHQMMQNAVLETIKCHKKLRMSTTIMRRLKLRFFASFIVFSVYVPLNFSTFFELLWSFRFENLWPRGMNPVALRPTLGWDKLCHFQHPQDIWHYDSCKVQSHIETFLELRASSFQT